MHGPSTVRTMRALLAGTLVAALLAGCEGIVPAPPIGGLATPDIAAGLPSIEPGDVRFTCGRIPFDPAILAERRIDEAADTAVAGALRKHLARDEMDIAWLPDAGWTLVGQDAQGAEFVAPGEGEQAYVVVSVGPLIGEPQASFAVGGLAVDGWGGCTPTRVLPAGIGIATWELAPGEAVGPATTGVDVLVTERDCASAQSSEGRIVGPEVVATAEAVTITFAVWGLPGAQMCPGNPATRVRVTLPEPLGDRRLLDGSTLPAQPRS